jgi:NAD(P)-dependent dehydrogenase (short-subunit alcohol dehydrogenase family)
MKRVVITGVTKGLGRAMAEFFMAKNITVIGCGRNLKELNAFSDQYRAPHFFSRVDVRDDASVRRWADYCLLQGAPPDMLINNAALISRNAPLWTLAPNDVDPVLDVNIRGVVNVIRHFLPSMIKRGKGVVVNFSSGWGRSTSPGVATYCASKWAIEGLTAALSQELPEGLAAVALNPGIINTEMLRSSFGESAASYPSPSEWIKSAGPFLMQLDATHNGKSLTVPGAITD